MKSSLNTLLLAGLGLCLSACAPLSAVKEDIQDSGVRLEESHLTQAGFKLVLADNADRQKILGMLPPDTLTRIQKDGTDYYIYPDPDGCVCLYVGREAEYQRLQQLAMELQISNQQLRANDLATDAQSGWGPMGPWGNWGANANNPGQPNWDPH